VHDQCACFKDRRFTERACDLKTARKQESRVG